MFTINQKLNVTLIKKHCRKKLQWIIKYVYVHLDLCYNSIIKWNIKTKTEWGKSIYFIHCNYLT